MDHTLKNRYPFRLGTTSFIYPAGYGENVRRLAPIVDEIELLFLESSRLPAPGEISELAELAERHGITYNVHLPMDVDPAAAARQTRREAVSRLARAMDCAAPLNPTTYTLHIPYARSERTNDSADVAAWQDTASESLRDLLTLTGAPPRSISIENLDFPPLWLLPIAKRLDFSFCIDIGHMILNGFDLAEVLKSFSGRTTILHLQGVAAGRDHQAVNHLTTGHRRTISRFLQNFKGSVSIEVFNPEHLEASLDHFPELMDAADSHTA